MTSPQHRDIEITATPPTRLRDGRRFVVTLGINSYAAWPRLHNAINDANAVHERLVALGFEPVAPPLLDEAATRDALQWLATDGLAMLEHCDSLVVFFAGHGHTHTQEFDNGDRHQIGYIIPVDAKAPSQGSSSWIRVDHWLRDIARLPARHILVILDSCHSGIALAIEQNRGATKESLATLASHRSRRVVTSARQGEFASDGGALQGHSRFTGALLETLANSGSAGDQVITGTALALQVQHRVIGLSKSESPQTPQTPDFGRFLLDDGGDLLIPTGETGAAASAVGAAHPLASPLRSLLRRAPVIGDFLDTRAGKRRGGLSSLFAAAVLGGIAGLIFASPLLIEFAETFWLWLIALGALCFVALHIVCSTHRPTLRYRYAQSLRTVSKIVAVIATGVLMWRPSTAVSKRGTQVSFRGAVVLPFRFHSAWPGPVCGYVCAQGRPLEQAEVDVRDMRNAWIGSQLGITDRSGYFCVDVLDWALPPERLRIFGSGCKQTTVVEFSEARIASQCPKAREEPVRNGVHRVWEIECENQ